MKLASLNGLQGPVAANGANTFTDIASLFEDTQEKPEIKMSEINLEEQAFALNEKISFTGSCLNAFSAAACTRLLFTNSVFLPAFEIDSNHSSDLFLFSVQ